MIFALILVMIRTIIQSLLITIMFSACASQVVLTNSIRQEYKLSENTLKGLDFVLTKSIVLYRIDQPDAKVGSNGGLIVKEFQEVIRIPEGTKGKAVFVGVDRIAIQFNDDCDCYLFFGSSKANDGYALLAEDWENGHGKVEYNGKTYFASPGSGKAVLSILMTKVKNGSTMRILPGVN
ncbi:MAG: hypothetical protein ACJAU0_000557 [Flavobacteriales bacterium]|jgi:hypothetical protein